jgi:hypothetical protein
MNSYYVLRNASAPQGMRCGVCGANHGCLYTHGTRQDHDKIIVIDGGRVVQVGARVLDKPDPSRGTYRVKLADGSEVLALVEDVRGVPS